MARLRSCAADLRLVCPRLAHTYGNGQAWARKPACTSTRNSAPISWGKTTLKPPKKPTQMRVFLCGVSATHRRLQGPLYRVWVGYFWDPPVSPFAQFCWLPASTKSELFLPLSLTHSCTHAQSPPSRDQVLIAYTTT